MYKATIFLQQCFKQQNIGSKQNWLKTGHFVMPLKVSIMQTLKSFFFKKIFGYIGSSNHYRLGAISGSLAAVCDCTQGSPRAVLNGPFPVRGRTWVSCVQSWHSACGACFPVWRDTGYEFYMFLLSKMSPLMFIVFKWLFLKSTYTISNFNSVK